MAELTHRVPIQVEYNPKKRRISLNRIFQIPQMFRPAASVSSPIRSARES